MIRYDGVTPLAARPVRLTVDLQTDLESLRARLLALAQPVATDLRNVLVCMRIATVLERIADLSVSISEEIIFLVDGTVVRHT